MKELTWYFPTRFEEVVELLREPGVVPHGGGTGLLRTGLGRLSGLIDLQRLPIHDFRAEHNRIELGAGLTFADVISHMKHAGPSSVLVKALSRAAATPLRNRITVGGSVAMAPPWSDLVGPLLALDAEICLAGADRETYPLSEYVSDRTLHKGTLVKSVHFSAEQWRSHYVRATATQFDYASFTLTVLIRLNPGRVINDVRLVVGGAKQNFQRLSDLEQRLIGQRADAPDWRALAAQADVEFAAKAIGSADYVRELFGVELERALLGVVGISPPGTRPRTGDTA
jgi:CO/xanthine dehydrogenase FAD-binding subunit